MKAVLSLNNILAEFDKVNTPRNILKLFDASGELIGARVDENCNDQLKLVLHPTKGNITLRHYKDDVYEVFSGMYWFDEDEGELMIADVVLYWDAKVKKFIEACSSGVSFEPSEWLNPKS